MQLRERLDASFASEPPHRPVDERITAGHAALLRRRMGQGLASFGIAALIVTSVAALDDVAGHSSDGLAPTAGGGRTSSTDGEPTTGPDVTPWPAPESLAYLDSFGSLHVHPDATLRAQQWVRLSGRGAPDREVELALTRDGKTWWLSLQWDEGKRTLVGETVGPWRSFRTQRFNTWVDEHRTPARTTSNHSTITGELQLVHFTASGDLVADRGSTLLDSRPDPGFVDVTEPGMPVAVAEVRAEDDRRWFVIARANSDGTTQNISAAPGTGQVPRDLDAFIAWARTKYASGEGLL